MQHLRSAVLNNEPGIIKHNKITYIPVTSLTSVQCDFFSVPRLLDTVYFDWGKFNIDVENGMYYLQVRPDICVYAYFPCSERIYSIVTDQDRVCHAYNMGDTGGTAYCNFLDSEEGVWVPATIKKEWKLQECDYNISNTTELPLYEQFNSYRPKTFNY